MNDVLEMINKGPVSSEQAAAASRTANAAPDTLGNTTVNDNTKTSSVLNAFDAVKGKESNESFDEAALKKALDEEEKKADDSPDKEPEDLPKGDAGDKKTVQESKKEVAKEEQDKTEKKPLIATARNQNQAVAEELRDLLPESAHHLLKKMDNTAKEFFASELKRRAKDVEELKSKLSVAEKQKAPEGVPAAWYDHEEAYTLTPEYRIITNQHTQIQSIADHYRNQLIAIKNGEDWFDLTQNEKGQIIQVKQKASPQADVLVGERIREAAGALNDLGKKEQALVQAWKSSAFNNRSQFKRVEDEYFPQYSNEAEFANNEDAKAVYTVLEQAGVRGDRMASMVAKLYAFAMEHVRKVQELETKVSGTRVNKQAGPTGDEINNGGGAKKELDPDEKPFNPNAFEKYRS